MRREGGRFLLFFQLGMIEFGHLVLYSIYMLYIYIYSDQLSYLLFLDF